MPCRLAAGPEGDGKQHRRHEQEEMRKVMAPEIVEPLEDHPGVGDAHGRDGERVRAQCHRRERGAGTPDQQRGSLVAGQMIHLADQRHRSAKGGGGDDPQSLSDGRVIARLRHRAADIAGKDDRKQDDHPDKPRYRLPIGGHEDQDGGSEQQRRHHRQDRTEAQRRALIGLDVTRENLSGRGIDETCLDPSRYVRPDTRGIAGHVFPPCLVGFSAESPKPLT